MEEQQEQKKVSAWNRFRRYLANVTATLILFMVYLIARAVKTPLWWFKIESFKTWNSPTEEYVEDKLDKVMAQMMAKARMKDMLLTVILVLLTPVYIFVPWFWFLAVIGTLGGASFIFVVIAFINIRTKRIKKEREQLNTDSDG